MTVALAIFVKTAGHSAVKTRLAEGIGVSAARECHERCAAAVAEVAAIAAAGDPALAPYWAVAEESALGQWHGFPSLAQGDGSLGQRMARVHGLLCPLGAAILVGADSPQLQAAQLLEAARWLSAPGPRVVLGPASDGGFWLVGANRMLPERGWIEVAYGRSDTAEAFRRAMHGQGEWLELATLADLDRPDDVAQIAHELAALRQPTPLQRELAARLRELDAGLGG